MNIFASPTHVSVSVRHGYRASIAEADEVKPGHWWIARVFIQECHRGQGLGSRLLQELIRNCTEQGARFIEVVPGGYDSDPVRQRAFYLQNGFKPVGSEKGLLGLRVQPTPLSPRRIFPGDAFQEED